MDPRLKRIIEQLRAKKYQLSLHFTPHGDFLTIGFPDGSERNYDISSEEFLDIALVDLEELLFSS